MLKFLLLSGWFRVQPLFKYAIVIIIIAPIVGISVNSSVAKQSPLKLGKNTSGINKSGVKSSVSVIVIEKEQTQKIDDINSGKPELKSELLNSLAITKPKRQQKQSLNSTDSNNGNQINHQLNLKVEIGANKQYHKSQKLIPQLSHTVVISDNSKVVTQEKIAKTPVKDNTVDLIEKLKDAKIETWQDKQNLLVTDSSKNKGLNTAINTANIRQPEPPKIIEIPVDEQPQQPDVVQNDPIGSPHPIPWQWILKTQAAIGGKGGSGTRHFRSIPVVSPDGRYMVYSRVQLEVQPEMHNSRVTSVLFLEDRQSKRLRVMSRTANVRDPLLNKTVNVSQNDDPGQIGVLVPISWSKKGDRFLARKFVGIFNTADVTDHTVVWDRNNDKIITVAPDRQEHEHKKIAILLGWSQQQPDHVLFRAGELGDEDWPLVQVASDGTGVNMTTDDDQPVTFREKDDSIWSKPQVASR